MSNNLPATEYDLDKISEIAMKSNKFCYSEFLIGYGHYIKPEFFEQIEEIDEFYFFNKGNNVSKPQKYIEKYFISEVEDSNHRLAIHSALSEIFKIRSSTYNAKLLIHLNKQELELTSYKDLMRIRRTMLLKHVDLLIKHRKKIGGSINSTFDALLELERVYPANILAKFENCEINNGNTYSQFLRKYPKVLAAMGKLEQSNNRNLKEVVIGFTDRILHMSASGDSNRKIQRVLTDECIENGIIPATVTRLSREKGARDEIISKPSKLPMSAIVKVIADNTQLAIT